MWLPRWLGGEYAKLYSEIGAKEFAFDNTIHVLGGSQDWAKTVLSALRRRGWLDVLARQGRKRIYRLAEPEEMIILLGKGIDSVRVPEVIRPIVRGYLAGLFSRFAQRIVSLALYGSFARGDYKENSDIDLLLVIRDFRWDESLSVDQADRLVHRLWELKHIHHSIQPYALTPEQAAIHRPIYLDMVEDAIIFYDEDGLITNVLEEMKQKLLTLGATRLRLPSGSWYWDLKPSMREGEIIEI